MRYILQAAIFFEQMSSTVSAFDLGYEIKMPSDYGKAANAFFH
jgi:hypothetical protein